MNIRRRILNILISLDQCFFSIITLGWAYPDEMLSAAAYRYSVIQPHWFGKILHRVLDLIYYPIEKNHCYMAYKTETEQTQLPPVLRRKIAAKKDTDKN